MRFQFFIKLTNGDTVEKVIEDVDTQYGAFYALLDSLTYETVNQILDVHVEAL